MRDKWSNVLDSLEENVMIVPSCVKLVEELMYCVLNSRSGQFGLRI